MFKKILILTYLAVLLLGTALFFIGFNGEKTNLEQNGSLDQGFKLLEIEHFEIEPIYDKVVYFIIDALRIDYLNIETKNPNSLIHNQFKYLNELMRSDELKNHIRFYNFKADFPTLTTFKIKSLMSGENPGLFELTSSLRPNNNTESSTILKNLFLKNKKFVIIGDDTWDLLYNELIHYNYKFESLNIRDFDSLDNYIEDKIHLFLNHTNIHYEKYNDWKFMVNHFIGVDHIGHYSGVYNDAMKNKLSQMDQTAVKTLQLLLKINNQNDHLTPKEFTKQVINSIKTNNKSEKILFLLFGDHGQNENGGHGGSCITETSAGFFAFSTIPFIASMEKIPEWDFPVNNKTSEQVSLNERIKNIKVLNQIDTVPIISSSLGIPIPENNLGIFREDFKIHLENGTEYDHHQQFLQEINYAKIMHNNALQIFNRFLHSLGILAGLRDHHIKSKYDQFYKSYQLLKHADLFRIQNYREDSPPNNYETLISICKKHYQLSYEFALLIQNRLFKDKSKFDWLSLTQGILIIFSLFIFVSVIAIPGFNLSMSRFMFNQKKAFLSSSSEPNEPSPKQLSIYNALQLKSVYKNTLNRWNIFIMGIAPVFVWFEWINNNTIVRILALIELTKTIYNSLAKRFRLRPFKESDKNVVETKNTADYRSIINQWLNQHLMLLFLLKKELIVPYSISSIIQLISIENLRLDGRNHHNSKENNNNNRLSSIPIKSIENIILLYLLSLNNFFNLASFIGIKESKDLDDRDNIIKILVYNVGNNNIKGEYNDLADFTAKVNL
ncbi:putative integral membrane protein [Cryptosporidium meleagridis]|uniref:Putative integral membrane protein n=1 Tax=Cryptosporidium meleagridis TaxID=93969 RepID=A0A2P4Z4D4_9CRYT|nr:putative integral membrane protein [Cryptosporidium meleagridis]